MVEAEGVIKYQLDFQKKNVQAWPGFAELNTWRNILYNLHLIGQDCDRYDGYGYGNISCRSNTYCHDKNPIGAAIENDGFYISGTQTGGKTSLTVDDYSLVTCCDVQHNHIVAEGVLEPSSEALSHGAVYQLDSNIQCVIHVHSDLLWRCAEMMKLPCTDKHVPYGTVAMADEIAGLYRSGALSQTPLFCMGGHTDGVITYGETIEQAGSALISQLALAVQHYK